MRVPYSWLREVVSAGAPGWDVSPDDLEAALIRIGHEVEDIITLGPGQRAADHRPGHRDRGTHRVQEAHPGLQGRRRRAGADRDIVCGATNFAVGDLVVVALPGTTLPGDFHIAVTQDLRPAVRRHDLLGRRTRAWAPTIPGSWCSRREPPNPALDGIDVLGLDDVVFDLAITPDRGYCLSVRGIAREIACAYDLDFVDPADVAPLPVEGDGVAADRRSRHRGAAGSRCARSPVSTSTRCRRGGCAGG